MEKIISITCNNSWLYCGEHVSGYVYPSEFIAELIKFIQENAIVDPEDTQQAFFYLYPPEIVRAVNDVLAMSLGEQGVFSESTIDNVPKYLSLSDEAETEFWKIIKELKHRVEVIENLLLTPFENFYLHKNGTIVIGEVSG